MSAIRQIVWVRPNVYHQRSTSDEDGQDEPLTNHRLYISQLGVAYHFRGHEYRVVLRLATMHMRHSIVQDIQKSN